VKNIDFKKTIVIILSAAFLLTGSFVYNLSIVSCNLEECCNEECCNVVENVRDQSLSLSFNEKDCCEFDQVCESTLKNLITLSQNSNNKLISSAKISYNFCIKQLNEFHSFVLSTNNNISQSHVSVLRI
jgi:hypothetical protein